MRAQLIIKHAVLAVVLQVFCGNPQGHTAVVAAVHGSVLGTHCSTAEPRQAPGQAAYLLLYARTSA